MKSVLMTAASLWLGVTPPVYSLADCAREDSTQIWFSPASPEAGETVRVFAVSADLAIDGLRMGAQDSDADRPVQVTRRGGPPYSLDAEVRLPLDGSGLRIEATRGDERVACRSLKPGTVSHSGSHDWSRANEAFFAAWIETLFDGPEDEGLNFKSLEPVLRDPDRNVLHNALGYREDERLPATPDCADLPYFLRAYFAWKVGLPVSFRACDRGTGSRPPHCGRPTLDTRFTQGPVPASSFTGLMRKIADTVHSGSARTGLQDEATDFYPIPLDQKRLWPGTVYADPYGHTLIIAKWIPQKGRQPGILLAADAQPDNSVSRKRFWEGNFLFANLPSAGPGFKAFRPLLLDGSGFALPDNAHLATAAPGAPFSDEQEGLSADAFYTAMKGLINPKGLDPEAAYTATLAALMEQLKTRVVAVENGERYRRQHGPSTINMPAGASIFETQGAWEDYASPSRDMRLLIALKVVEALPEAITAHPDLFSLGSMSPDAARSQIETLHQQSIKDKTIRYLRSDGSEWELSLEEIFARREALEVGYNPNDCAEVRWGASPDTAESATCTRHAPADQQAKMMHYRNWFKNTQRPSR